MTEPQGTAPAPKPLVYVITGPTASGKTALSLRLAQAHHCEIICMDSMQIYRGMDIGTAKATPEEQALVPHHMLDVADPWEAYSVARYTAEAAACAMEIIARGNIPLFVGGTGFYLRALRHPMRMGATQGDPALRDELQTLADQPGGRERLHAKLAQVDPVSAARLHVNDVRRVIRALEVYRITGSPISRQTAPEEDTPFRYRVAALTMERSLLYQRINLRVKHMLQQGLLDEVRGLLAAGVPPEAQSMQALGYKELMACIRGECTLDEAAEAIQLGTRHYAKRQLTWLRREDEVCWLDAAAPDAYAHLEAWMIKGEKL